MSHETRSRFDRAKPLVLLACLVAGGKPLPADEPGPAPPTCPPLTRIRFVPREGHAKRMVGGRFTGSNEGKTTDFQTIARVESEPPDGGWTEVTPAKPVRYRFLKYESPLGGWGDVAEVEFYSGDRKLAGEVFGTTGSREAGHDFSKATDGDKATYFEGAEPHGQYVGIDLGPGVQAAPVTFTPEPGSYPTPQTVAMSTGTPGATIRFTRNGGAPGRATGEPYQGPVKVEKGTVLAAVAFTEDSAESRLAVVAYRIRSARQGRQGGPHVPRRQQPDRHRGRLARPRGAERGAVARLPPVHHPGRPDRLALGPPRRWLRRLPVRPGVRRARARRCHLFT